MIFYTGERLLAGRGLYARICVFIDHLEKYVISDMTRFDDGKKFFRVGRMKTETKELQKDIRKQHEWAIKWQMKFSIDLYTVRYAQRNKPVFREKDSASHHH